MQNVLQRKKEVKECLKSFRKTRENADYVEYANQRKEYKKLIKDKRCADKKSDL